MVDAVLDLLEPDPSFTHFLLDGQTAMVDDYLEIRPEAESRINALAGAGRLALGPWHSQPDEFLVSGETLVRNLQTGMARSAELGGTMAVGYLPDSFGHAAQMPQLLRLAGIGHAVVFRGVPDSVESTAFWWEAPDGSRVRAEHLALGYTNAFRLPDDPDGLVARAGDLDARAGRPAGRRPPADERRGPRGGPAVARPRGGREPTSSPAPALPVRDHRAPAVPRAPAGRGAPDLAGRAAGQRRRRR